MTPLSAYDDDVPGAGRHDALAAAFADLREKRPPVDLGRLRDVVLLVGSSRGGTSMLTDLLRDMPGLLSLPGEMNPYVAVAQLGGDGAEVVADELARAVGRPARTQPDAAVLAGEVRWRLLAQWPQLTIPAELVGRAVRQTLAQQPADDRALTGALLAVLAAAVPQLDPAAYDSARPRPAARRTPVEPIVEMTPYVGFRCWRAAADAELASMPLVIGTPRNSFRLDWLRTLFAGARLRVLHLTRNPAAAVNGLIDGWQHWGFVSARSPVPLAVGEWWCFDIPPRWRELTAAALPAVAAEQWASPHRAVLAHTGSLPAGDVLRIRYESLVGPHDGRVRAAEDLGRFLGIDPTPIRDRLLRGSAPVMATSPPAPRRWASAGNDLAPALAEPAVWDVAAALGYEAEEPLWI